MKKHLEGITHKLKCTWSQCLIQSLLALISIFIVLIILTVEEAVIVASIGATAFIVFAMPRSIPARPRNVIGGHLAGIITGSLCALIPHQQYWAAIAVYSLSVGITMFLMVVTETEHPPAGGTALGIAIGGFSPYVTITMAISVLVLSLIHRSFRRYLTDLC